MRYAILEAPSILGLKPNGVEMLADRMLEHGLCERIGARVAGRVATLPYSPERDPETLTLNAKSIAAWSPKLADSVGDLVDRGEMPIILGGDCTILLGSMLALKRRGRYGLLFIDGHADFYQPEVNPNGEGASMELAFATGHGPKLLTEIEGQTPLVREEDVVAFAFRDAEEQARFGSQPLPAKLRGIDLPTIRRIGIEAAARDAIEHVTREELDGFFIHVDADCLDDAIMPAVEYHLTGGLSFDELVTVLRTALATGKAVGLELTIYNPKLDPDGSAGRGLADALVRALAPVH